MAASPTRQAIALHIRKQGLNVAPCSRAGIHTLPCQPNPSTPHAVDASAPARLLAAQVPDSILWLLRFPALAVPNIRAAAARAGILPERIVFTDVAEKVTRPAANAAVLSHPRRLGRPAVSHPSATRPPIPGASARAL